MTGMEESSAMENIFAIPGSRIVIESRQSLATTHFATEERIGPAGPHELLEKMGGPRAASIAMRPGHCFHLSRGYPKLFGSTQRFVEAFQAIGLPAYAVYVAGAIEFFGGVALALGLFTPVRTVCCSIWPRRCGNTT